MKPNAEMHNPDPDYLRELVAKAGLTQREAARLIGVDARTMRYYLAYGSSNRAAPYVVQFALEALAETDD